MIYEMALEVIHLRIMEEKNILLCVIVDKNMYREETFLLDIFHS